VGYRRLKAFHELSLGGDLTGLTIRVRHRTGRDLQRLGELAASANPPSPESPWGLLPLFLDALHWWDLETDDGGLVPPTHEALMDFDDAFLRDVLTAYWYSLELPYPSGQVQREVELAAAHRGEAVVTAQVTDARTFPDVPGRPQTDPDAADADDMVIPPVTGPSLEDLKRFKYPVDPDAPVPVLEPA
jgi:hypothetical protein